jgi:hypothetical protein
VQTGVEQRCQQTEVEKTCGNRHEPDGGDNPPGSTEQRASYNEHQTRANSRRSSCSCRHELNERHVETSLSSPNQSSDTPMGILLRITITEASSFPASGKDFRPWWSLEDVGSLASWILQRRLM